MTKKMTQALKLILVVFSLYLGYVQYTTGNMKMLGYWIVVALYWFFNYLSGRPTK